MPAPAPPGLIPDRNREANLPRGPSSDSNPRVLRSAAARRHAWSNWQAKTLAAKTTRRTNPRHANQGPYFRGWPQPTMRAQRAASESDSDHTAVFATLPKPTATATTEQKRLRPARVLRHSEKTAHANTLRTVLPERR